MGLPAESKLSRERRETRHAQRGRKGLRAADLVDRLWRTA